MILPLQIPTNTPQAQPKLPVLLIKETPNHKTPAPDPRGIQGRRILLRSSTIHRPEVFPGDVPLEALSRVSSETVFVENRRRGPSIGTFGPDFI